MPEDRRLAGEGGFQRRYTKHQAKVTSRLPVKIEVEMGGTRGIAAGIARDLTEDGIQILTAKHYPVGDRFATTLKIPGFAHGFDFAVEVCWVDFAGREDFYLVGCKFVHSAESKKTIKNLMWEINSGNIPEVMRRKKTMRRKKQTRRTTRRKKK